MTKPTAYSTDKNGITWLPVSAIRTDAGTQHRPALDEKAVEDYAQQMRAKEWNWRRSPIRITKEGDVYWMIGGFHRLAAAERADLKLIGCVVQPGTRRDAILASFSENSHHGVRLDNASKRNKVLKLLEDEEWRTWSDHIIAKRCGVSHAFVGKLRVTGNVSSDSTERTYVNKQGGVSKMDTASNRGRSEKGADSAPDDLVKVRADLDPSKWYPTNQLTKKILFDAFDSPDAVRSDERYKLVHVPTAGFMLKDHIQYRDYMVIPGLPKAQPKAEAATPPAAAVEQHAPGRAYPMAAAGNVLDDKYYPTNSKLAQVYDEPFDDHSACLKDPRYPGNKPIYGQTLNHNSFFQIAHFRLVAPIIASNDTAPGIISNDAAPTPACRMIFEPSDRFGDYVGSFEEQFLLDADYWSSEAHDGNLPASTEPARLPYDPERFYPVDDRHHHVYYDPRLAAETIHSPYRAVSGRDLNLVPDFESYRRIDADLPCPIIPSIGSARGPAVTATTTQSNASPRPPVGPEPLPARPNHPGILDDKFYITDKRGSKIFTQPYDTINEAHRHIVSPFDQRTEKGSNLNSLFQYERWTLVTPTNGNGNGNGAARSNGTPWVNSNIGKDTPRNAHEAIEVANGQAAQRLAWQNALDFRILVETNMVEVDEETLKRCARPLRALVIEALKLGGGEIDREDFGAAVRTYVSAVSEKAVKEPAR